MKITMDHNTFRNIVEALKPLTSKDNGRPTLQYIHLRAEGNELMAEALNGCILLRVHVPATIDEPGEMLLPDVLKIPAAGKSTFPFILVEGGMSWYSLNIPAQGTSMAGKNAGIQDDAKFFNVDALFKDITNASITDIWLDPNYMGIMAKAFQTLTTSGREQPVHLLFSSKWGAITMRFKADELSATGILLPVRPAKEED